MSGESRRKNPLPLLDLVGDGAGAACWFVEEYDDGGEVPFMRGGATGSRVDRPGSVPSMDDIDMLLPGRVVVDRAGSSRPPEKGGGGGGTRDIEACALYCGEGGSIGRPPNGGGGGGGGGGLSCATKDVMTISKHVTQNLLQKSLEKGAGRPLCEVLRKRVCAMT